MMHRMRKHFGIFTVSAGQYLHAFAPVNENQNLALNTSKTIDLTATTDEYIPFFTVLIHRMSG